MFDSASLESKEVLLHVKKLHVKHNIIEETKTDAYLYVMTNYINLKYSGDY